MFNQTKALLWQTVKQIKNITFFISVLIHGLTAAYLLYALITDTGNFIANISLFIVSLLYLCYLFYKQKHQIDKKTKKQVNRWNRYAKRIIKLYQIIPMVVIILTSDTANPITFLTVIFSALMLAVQILFDILIAIIEKRLQLFKEAFDNDVNEITKPVTAISDFFKKMTGKTVEEKQESKNNSFFKSLVEEYKQAKAEKKAQKKQEKQEKKQILLEEIAVSDEQDENA